MRKLKVLSYNIHKGFSGGIKKYTLHRMREELRKLSPDLIFLQEVHGHHALHKKQISSLPQGSQFEYLAQEIWPHFSYGRNAVYTKGNHGNAILSKYPILSWQNSDISTNRFERRGLLHGVIALPFYPKKIHLFCTHLDLLEVSRRKQLKALSLCIREVVSRKEALILAGDFNDWRLNADSILREDLNLKEASFWLNGKHAVTFPSFFPIFALDRIYFRGLKVAKASSLFQSPWNTLSDHLPLKAEFILSKITS